MKRLIAATILLILISSSAHAVESKPEVVTIKGYSLSYRGKEFLGLGTSYMSALRHCRQDYPLFCKNLGIISKGGFNYIRVLSMVGWYPAWEGNEIAPITFTNKNGKQVTAWKDYDTQFEKMIDTAYDKYGLRTQITIFADAQLMPGTDQRAQHLDRILKIVKGREHKIILLEIANEAWQNGFPGESGIKELKNWCKYLKQRTPIPVALSSPPGSTIEAIRELYEGSEADIATVHFTRDTRSDEGRWLPVRECWDCAKSLGIPISSNEPIGPGASVESESDELLLVSAAVFAFTAGLPMYVFHTSAGVFGLEPFESMPGIYSFKHLRRLLPRDLPNWTRSDGSDETFPVSISCERSCNGKLLRSTGADCMYVPGAQSGQEFIASPMGIADSGINIKFLCAAKVKISDPITGKTILHKKVNANDIITIPKGSGICIIRGTRI